VVCAVGNVDGKWLSANHTEESNESTVYGARNFAEGISYIIRFNVTGLMHRIGTNRGVKESLPHLK
jgi:hypothetical protein